MHCKITSALACILLIHMNTAAQTLDTQTEVWVTAKDTPLRLSRVADWKVHDYRQPVEKEQFVYVDASHEFQTLLGIGGAITDASAEVFDKLPADEQQRLLEAYFDRETGIGYSLLRTTIHSCDFSPASYTYVEENDKELASFSIAHDLVHRIPLIRRAIATRGEVMPLYVSPWSPPAWMKDTGTMLQGGKLLPEFAATWATYITKTIHAYEQEGLPVWGLTVQNEPMAVQTWESCVFTAEEERDFVKNHLGPTLVREGLGDRKLIVWDHNRDLIFQRASTIFNDAEAAKYVWGIGFHWYETWTKTSMNFRNLQLTHETFPDKHLMFTEGCAESFDPERMEAWELGERYGASMIQDFNCGTVGWTDWNILLDEHGGPNHVGNFCFAPVHADMEAGTLIFTSSYYYIGHFSKFVQPGAKRIAASSSRTNLLAVAFKNPDASLAVVVMNESEEALPYFLIHNGRMLEITAPARSIATVVIKAQ